MAGWQKWTDNKYDVLSSSLPHIIEGLQSNHRPICSLKQAFNHKNMFLDYEPRVLYGVMEGNRSAILEEEWLYDNFANVPGDLVINASDVVRQIMGNAVYGFILNFDSTTGQAQEPTEEQKQCIQTLYDRLRNYWNAVNRSNMAHEDEEKLKGMTPEERQVHQKKQEEKILERMPKMGYFLAVSGDYSTETEHETYTPIMEDDTEEEQEKEEEDKEEEKDDKEEEGEEERKTKRRKEG